LDFWMAVRPDEGACGPRPADKDPGVEAFGAFLLTGDRGIGGLFIAPL
jgi:hypothetical protein